MGEELGGALEAELQVRPACPAQPSPAPFSGTEQQAALEFSSYLWADRTQDNPLPACGSLPCEVSGKVLGCGVFCCGSGWCRE